VVARHRHWDWRGARSLISVIVLDSARLQDGLSWSAEPARRGSSSASMPLGTSPAAPGRPAAWPPPSVRANQPGGHIESGPAARSRTNPHMVRRIITGS